MALRVFLAALLLVLLVVSISEAYPYGGDLNDDTLQAFDNAVDEETFYDDSSVRADDYWCSYYVYTGGRTMRERWGTPPVSLGKSISGEILQSLSATSSIRLHSPRIVRKSGYGART